MLSIEARGLRAFSQRAKRSILAVVAVAVPLTASLTTPLSAAAAPALKPATDVFIGTATTNTPGMGPIVFAGQPQVLADGTMLVPYMYKAAGSATGDVRGTFTYTEMGKLYISLATQALVGSEFNSGVFQVTPEKKNEAPVTIVDTSPTTYQHGVATADVADLGKAMDTVNKALAKGTDTKVTKGALTYGWFTFTDKYGTFKGIATPDFSQFAITITFDVPAKDKAK